MIYRFKNNNSYLNINKDANIVEYNKKNFSIIKIFLIEKFSGKIETEEHIIKWSKKELYVYDKLYSISFLEKMEYIETDIMYLATLKSSEPEKKFYYSKSLNITIKTENEMVYIIGPGDTTKELVIDIKNLGNNSKIYTTSNGNKLYYSETICKYNSLGIVLYK